MERTQTLRLGVGGALGRMGQTVLAVAADEAGVAVTAAIDQPGSADQSVGGVKLIGVDEALAACDVIIDFSTAAAAAALAAKAAARGSPALVIGATGSTRPTRRRSPTRPKPSPLSGPAISRWASICWRLWWRRPPGACRPTGISRSLRFTTGVRSMRPRAPP